MTDTGLTVIEPTPENIRTWLVVRIAHYLDEPTGTVDPDAPLADYGLDSVYAFVLCGEIEEFLSVAVEPTVIWDLENLMALADHIVDLAAGRSSQ